MKQNEYTGRLENWRVHTFSNGSTIFWGEVYGDTRGRFSDGSVIHTSLWVEGEAVSGSTIKTQNSTYLLGEPLDLCEEKP